MTSKKLGYNATWSMAVGGMVGGGIFSVTGLIVQIAGKWAWLSFLLAGIIALISAYSFSKLTLKFRENGGIFTYLRDLHHYSFAGSLAWILILGYILTISVYAYTFGEYVAHVFNLASWFPALFAILILTILTLVNLKGVGEASWVEIITVWGKLAVLALLAIYGIFHWNTGKLNEGLEEKTIDQAITGAATIFMAYEGFELLSYDYSSIKNPDVNLPKALFSAVIAVIVVYIAVFFGITMIVGPETIIKQKEVALSYAGKAAFGTFGLVLVTIAAAFSTSSAINATLFSTSKLVEDVASKKDLPLFFSRENANQMPYIALLSMSGAAMVLTALGDLGSLVSAASIIFLFIFGTVNFIAWQESVKYKGLCLGGAIAAYIAIIMDGWYLAQKSPAALIILAGLVLAVILGRRYLKKYLLK